MFLSVGVVYTSPVKSHVYLIEILWINGYYYYYNSYHHLFYRPVWKHSSWEAMCMWICNSVHTCWMNSHLHLTTTCCGSTAVEVACGENLTRCKLRAKFSQTATNTDSAALQRAFWFSKKSLKITLTHHNT